jgi:hypothetical protein
VHTEGMSPAPPALPTAPLASRARRLARARLRPRNGNQAATVIEIYENAVWAWREHTGEPLRRGALMRRYRRAFKAAKLDNTLRFHDLRHTFGIRMAASGVSMRTLQECMHRDIQTTQIYADYPPSVHEVAQVSAAFACASGAPCSLRRSNMNATLLLATRVARPAGGADNCQLGATPAK